MSEPIAKRKRFIGKTGLIALSQALAREGLKSAFTGGVKAATIERPNNGKQRPFSTIKGIAITPLYDRPVGVFRTCYTRKTK